MSIKWPGVHSMRLLICGDPRNPPYQIVMTGVHLNLRIGGTSREGAAFGGPQVYGDQRGNGRVGLPGNTYRYQMESAHRLFSAMTPAERGAARVETAPAQTLIDPQGDDGRFDGIAVAELDAGKRGLAREIVAGILENYAEEDAAYAWECLHRNGGVDALRLADYDVDFQGGRHAGDAPSQIFRLEGPAAVFHFRGEPHLHAFVNVTMDPAKPLSVGELLGVNPDVLEGESLRAFFETAMCEQAGADAAVYPSPGIVGRLRAGPIRVGDIWVAESWVNELAVVDVDGGELSPELRRTLTQRGTAPQTGKTYRIATTDYIAGQEPQIVGHPRGRGRTLGPLRDALVAHARTHGFG
jgi:hypothetical protein